MSTDTTTTLTTSRRINGTPDDVFRAWTEPDRLRRWSCPEGAVVEEAQVDLTVGGGYRIRMQTDTGIHTAVGTYREIDRPHRLVYTWDWEEQATGETVVTVEFRAADGGTEVVLTHELFPNAEARDGHQQGWESCLNQLERLLA